MLHPLTSTIPHPARLNDPFDYTPHPLVRQAARAVTAFVADHDEWAPDVATGKMFGVLIAQTREGATGFLAAFSGLLGGGLHSDYFVPPIFDILLPDGHFQHEQARISALNRQIALAPQDSLNTQPLLRERKQRSEALQDWLFGQYRPLNARGETASIAEIFTRYYRTTMLRPERFERNARSHHIPSGTGDCCAPRLLHYAFAHGLRPLAMGEWQIGPTGELCFHPACQGRCRPLLWHMLQGLELEPGPRSQRANAALGKTVLLYEDESLVALDKPSGVLSVPGRSGEPSVMDWLAKHGIRAYYPAHRLDQDTSGLLLVAKTPEAYAQLQAQFIGHRVRKTYTALLDGNPDVPNDGIINLPLRPDTLNRPRQVVDLQNGKPATTHYHIVERGTRSRVVFHPLTGRTHQLRLHSAHPLGLNCPIVGDRLYGHASAHALCLHATAIEFAHPCTGKCITLECPPPFTTPSA